MTVAATDGHGALHPVSVLIAALGGEGGGLLTAWLVSAATASGRPVQSTSIPGVAQRTGATTYYLEIYPDQTPSLGGRDPVMALYPSPGHVDLVVASELVEAGRCLELGYVSPDRTTLVASTHRVYAIAEKSAMGDGRYDHERVWKAARALARRPILSDLSGLAAQTGAPLNAVLLGVMAGSGVLPMSPAELEEGIRRVGVAVESNLQGFALGLAHDRSPAASVPDAEPRAPRAVDRVPAPVDSRLERYPIALHHVLSTALERLEHYQDQAYADQFLSRLSAVHALDERLGGGERHWALTRETARYLALWMSYEDVIRVADLKTRPERMRRIRGEVGAREDEPVRVTEFLKPGLPELCAVLPVSWAARVERWAAADERRARLHLPLRVKTHTVCGYLALRGLARLRPWRRASARFRRESELVERWLQLVGEAARRDYRLGLEVVECANLNKGYGETFERGRSNFLRIVDVVVERALADPDPADGVTRVRLAREAALADPDGRALGERLVASAATLAGTGVVELKADVE